MAVQDGALAGRDSMIVGGGRLMGSAIHIRDGVVSVSNFAGLFSVGGCGCVIYVQSRAGVGS